MLSELRLPALEVRQTERRTLYSFAVEGKSLPKFAAVSRIRRDASSHIEGYQRPEVLAHIDEIRRYLESENPILPNSLVVAFDQRVRFVPSVNGHGPHTFARHGTLVIPIDSDCADAEKPGWVVDGQQRAAALRDAQITSFPVLVTAFIADGVEEQRAQFILVNSTKPLPKGLVYELLPGSEGRLPTALARKRLPAKLLERLNFDADSLMRGMIQTPTNGLGIVKDNSILKMVDNSLTNGALFAFQDRTTGAVDEDAMAEVLKQYWRGVSIVFPDAWGIRPRRSRLMHGAGIVSMGLVMDAIYHGHEYYRVIPAEDLVLELESLRESCAWTQGFWAFGPNATRKWNDIQNTPRDIQVLSDYLLARYKQFCVRKIA